MRDYRTLTNTQPQTENQTTEATTFLVTLSMHLIADLHPGKGHLVY